MKFVFDNDQGFQKEAVASVLGVFAGQPIRDSHFTVATGAGAQLQIGSQATEVGTANAPLALAPEALLHNLNAVQDRHRLPRSASLTQDDQYGGIPNLSVEMETGTGKTYVYVRTMLQLAADYGWKKFVVVVPGVAVREGVLKSLKVTRENFQALFPGMPFDFFSYDSENLGQVRSFATSSAVQIMVINIDAFRKVASSDGKKASRRMHEESDKLSGARPIDLLSSARPVVIIDEPQSVDGTDKAKESVMALNPLFIVRYSATHREKRNLVYRLGPVEAFEQGLVKRIRVATSRNNGDENLPYLKVTAVTKKNAAKVEIWCRSESGDLKRKEVAVNTAAKSDIFELSNENPNYSGWKVDGVDATPGSEAVILSGNRRVPISGHIGSDGVDAAMRRKQIQETIRTHLDREAELVPRGVKVLSLIFIDEVAKYRSYGPQGSVPGEYAQAFEEEYAALIAGRRGSMVTDLELKRIWSGDVAKAHNGYFAGDKKVYSPFTAEGGEKGVEDDVFGLIMRDKERLLDLKEPLRFVFSHSALKEGWDNPNVFQICTLVETQDRMTKRQKIGRGLRLAVDQSGERIKDEGVNVLTVVANESYQQFADGLQRELEKDAGVKFGVIENPAFFAQVLRADGQGGLEPIPETEQDRVFEHFHGCGYLTQEGKVTDKLRDDLAANRPLSLPAGMETLATEVRAAVLTVVRKLPVLPPNAAPSRRTATPDGSADFKALWDRIKPRSEWTADFKTSELVEAAAAKVAAIRPRRGVVTEVRDANVTRTGVGGEVVSTYVSDLAASYAVPNAVEILQRDTGLKKGTVAAILDKANAFAALRKDPGHFLAEASVAVREVKREYLLKNVRYAYRPDLGEYEFSAVFPEEIPNLDLDKAVSTAKSAYGKVAYQSDVEKRFAEGLNSDAAVKFFLKLPKGFAIPTPIGDYIPDWAVLVTEGGQESLYFVVETKGSMDGGQLRFSEGSKIDCGAKHFAATGTGVKFEKASGYGEWQGKRGA
jgi:type III restriction enzyme